MTSTVRIGALLPTREMAILNDFSIAPLLDFARRAEKLGYDSLWTGDSLVARTRLDPFVVLSAAAAVTERITLGTGALTASLRHPLLGANMVTSLDHASGGDRLVLGLGAGFPMPESEDEFTSVGVPFAGRVGRLDETVRYWKTAWSARTEGAPTVHKGTIWQTEGLDRLAAPATAGGPPLWLAGSDTPRVLARAARLYDGWLPFLPTDTAYAAAWSAIQEQAAAHGRPEGAVTPGLYATVNINPDAAKAKAQLEEYLQGYYGRSLEIMSTFQAYGWGSADDCAEWLAGYIRAGARHIVVRIGSLDPGDQLDQLAEAVLPAVRALV
ncbi:LLM class flavin-dependent oxidoreductase [Actinokineospora iranica]|uniref:Flavin-dependent oxidoreductase, luciferase family (Includes alkanesulfonate monooxygenase SsuD and methylene tetrahydromethanopterin reductase) n=1 Tax=Actinokineospora iranica TaxID=1271860 RepID=A0A1G6SN00_9PSEU|nr:LLM class flavin-dependent oxidoreductase [Actinokineospora iranica]SDD18173.1 Flavin-dependent oxidoreductase, luciferase family (includes alkanesulfonate monooxygenase SsuD and methylene tetrahydromethanopterin reductase) [Actinokineospora iranica]